MLLLSCDIFLDTLTACTRSIYLIYVLQATFMVYRYSKCTVKNYRTDGTVVSFSCCVFNYHVARSSHARKNAQCTVNHAYLIRLINSGRDPSRHEKSLSHKYVHYHNSSVRGRRGAEERVNFRHFLRVINYRGPDAHNTHTSRFFRGRRVRLSGLFRPHEGHGPSIAGQKAHIKACVCITLR